MDKKTKVKLLTNLIERYTSKKVVLKEVTGDASMPTADGEGINISIVGEPNLKFIITKGDYKTGPKITLYGLDEVKTFYDILGRAISFNS